MYQHKHLSKPKFNSLYFALLSAAFIMLNPTVGWAVEKPPEILGLRETSNGTELIEAALKAANPVLTSQGKYKLVGSWQAKGQADGFRIIDIYAIDVDENRKKFGIMVPYDCDCVFVQPEVLREKIRPLHKELPQMLAVEEHDAVAFMLVHEVGHIDHGDIGNYTSAGKYQYYNLDETEQKRREGIADSFAAKHIVGASAPSKVWNAPLASMSIQLALANISYNLGVLRILKYFGGTSLCSRFLFADDGYTHPNLEMRFLMVNNIISNTETSRELLASFEKCRTNPANPILYKKDR